MKKNIHIFLVTAAMLFAQQAQAQSLKEKDIFSHLGAGVSLGTDGIGIEAATNITNYVGLRAGVSIIPKISYSKSNVKYTRNGIDGLGKVDASLKKIDGKVLVDVYPFAEQHSFHVTVGGFFGSKELVSGYFEEDLASPINGGISKKVGNAEWLVNPVDHKVQLRLATNSFKPYVGVGFGRMVPEKRVGVSCDLGVQFHGKPRLEGYATARTATGEQHQWVELEAQDFDFGEKFNDDVDKALDIIHNVIVYPVVNIRITGRIF